MAVLVEAVSVILRADRVDEHWPGGVRGFIDFRSNETVCEDGLILRIGFMGPRATKEFVERCEAFGLVYLDDNQQARDLVVIDQTLGFCAPCDWLEFGHVTMDGNQVACARMVGDERTLLMSPPGWRFEGSLSASHTYTPEGATNTGLRFLCEQDGLFHYLNTLTNRVVYSTEPLPDASQG